MAASAAKKNFELENKVQNIDDQAIYHYSEEEQDKIFEAKPWKENVNFFNLARISAVALVKMVMHAKSGAPNEVMGLMQGKVTSDGHFIILDSFPLPVEGTETRVNAGASANEFMINYIEMCERFGKVGNVVGWYHSHPGYGCWLSGIDVQTQMHNQQHQEPFLAVVVDPVRTCAAGRVDIGAFRTYPAGYTPPDEGPSEYQPIPLDKVEDFGVHCKQYYQLAIEIFKNSLDNTLLELLWNKYWIDTLSSSPLLHNRSFCQQMIQDCVQKIEQIDPQSRLRISMASETSKKRKDDNPLSKVAVDATKLAGEQLQGLTSHVVKYALFRGSPDAPVNAAQAAAPDPMETET